VTPTQTKQEDKTMKQATTTMAMTLMAACMLTGCMTYIRTANLKDSPVHLEGIRGTVQAQVGVQTRGQHTPGREQATMQEGGGRADTQAEIPIQIDRSQSTATPTPAAATTQAVDNAVVPVTPPASTNTPSADTNSVVALRWTYGGFDGSQATADALTISAVTFSKDGVSYAHTAYPASWGGTALACLFVLDADGLGGNGGKFDWAPESRTSRDWKNVRGSYSGGGGAWVEPADGAAVLFGLWSQDGKRRSNLVLGTWQRQ